MCFIQAAVLKALFESINHFLYVLLPSIFFCSYIIFLKFSKICIPWLDGLQVLIQLCGRVMSLIMSTYRYYLCFLRLKLALASNWLHVNRLEKEEMLVWIKLHFLRGRLPEAMENKSSVGMFTDWGSSLIFSEWCLSMLQQWGFTFVQWYVLFFYESQGFVNQSW